MMVIPKAALAAIAAVAAIMLAPAGAHAVTVDLCGYTELNPAKVDLGGLDPCPTVDRMVSDQLAPTNKALDAVSDADTDRLVEIATDPEPLVPGVDDAPIFDYWNSAMAEGPKVGALSDLKWGCRWYVTPEIRQTPQYLIQGTGKIHMDGDCGNLVAWRTRLERDSWCCWHKVHENEWQVVRSGHWTRTIYGCKTGTYDWRHIVEVRYPVFDGSYWHWEIKRYYSPTRRYKCLQNYPSELGIAT